MQEKEATWSEPAKAETWQRAEERWQAARKPQDPGLEDILWETIVAFSGYSFYTMKGLEFVYTVKHNPDGTPQGELFISRKNKSITKASVLMAYRKALQVMEQDGQVTGPKKLGTFGASYLLPIFVRLGICRTSAQLEFPMDISMPMR